MWEESKHWDPCRADPGYWDCECETNYIHKKLYYGKPDLNFCDLCGTHERDQPDSRLIEVVEMIVREHLPKSESTSHPLPKQHESAS